ncbi:hypothetical protein [Paraburkholderia adhaesiva]|uniref:hypothetical protein n=1 Tax=Paraburkholderia adhaesiva TaxID=2883244 RepID=UPI001F23F42F|nr:hypothetical protein [Paraburkholderia adhaesiva]
MGKRKIFVKTDLIVPQVDHARDNDGRVIVSAAITPEHNPVVTFGRNATSRRSFDFLAWYGVGIDPITFAFQRQIERFLAKQDAEVEVSTVTNYCWDGAAPFLRYLALSSAGRAKHFDVSDIDRTTIDGYLRFLADGGWLTPDQRRKYVATKAILKALCRRGLIREISAGDDATFPVNPFPGAKKQAKGETPLTKDQRKAFSVAVKTAVMPLFIDENDPSADLISYAYLVVALHTGRNTTPLLEMSPNCLRPHPKSGTMFLVLHKRRGHNTSKIALRADTGRQKIHESLPTVRPTVAALIERVLQLSAQLRAEAPLDIADRVWLYRSRRLQTFGKVEALSANCLNVAISNLVRDYQLQDTDGKPLRINVSRLRKTFVNRVYEILDGDVASTAAAAGNTAGVVRENYLQPGEEALKNWRFMGEALVQELLTSTLGSTEKTPVGRCSDPRNGDYAPKREGAVCMNFLNCLRCRNYVVTGDDLYRLFSFYWRVLRERSTMGKRRWKAQFAHIARLIESDVVQAGLDKGIFKNDVIEAERRRAHHDPHPFWRSETVMADLHGGLV